MCLKGRWWAAQSHSLEQSHCKCPTDDTPCFELGVPNRPRCVGCQKGHGPNSLREWDVCNVSNPPQEASVVLHADGECCGLRAFWILSHCLPHVGRCKALTELTHERRIRSCLSSIDGAVAREPRQMCKQCVSLLGRKPWGHHPTRHVLRSNRRVRRQPPHRPLRGEGASFCAPSRATSHIP